MSVNKVILIGNVGAKPDFRFMPNNGGVINFSLATNKRWKDKQTGEAKEKTQWHKIVIYNKLAEIARDNLRQGSKVYLEGELDTRKWQNQQGQDQYATEVIVNSMEMIANWGNANGQQSGGISHAPQQQQGGFQKPYTISPKHPNGVSKNNQEWVEERQWAISQGYQVTN